MDENSFVLLPSPEIDGLLADNGTDLAEILKGEGVEIEQRRAEYPAEAEEGREKDPVSIIVASAGAALALVPVLSRVLSALAHKTVLVKEMVLVPVEDSAGNVIRDSAGNPCLHWMEHSRLLESVPQSSPKSNVTAKGPLGLNFTYSEK